MKRILEVAFEGNDGSGKTTTINGVTKLLQQRKHHVETCAPFALANDILQGRGGPKDIYQLWISGEKGKVLEGLDLLETVVRNAREQISNNVGENGSGILIFDRNWMTVLRCMDDVPAKLIAATDVDIQSKLKFWMRDIVPTVFCEAKPEITKSSHKFHRARGWNSDDKQMEYEYDRRMYFVEKHLPHILCINEYHGNFAEFEKMIGDTADLIERVLKNLS